MTSPRFRNMTLNGYTALLDDSIEQQFVALTIDLGNGSIYISFRGTDDTIVGWKEKDLNTGLWRDPRRTQAVRIRRASRAAVQRQRPSVSGTQGATRRFKERRQRIVAVHNRLGQRRPSASQAASPQTSSSACCRNMKKRLRSCIRPDGLPAHDGFSWQVLGTQFVHLDDFSREGKLVDETLSSWADSLNTQQREALADALYSVFTRASGAKTPSAPPRKSSKRAAAMSRPIKPRPRDPPHGDRRRSAVFQTRHEELRPRHAGGRKPRDRTPGTVKGDILLRENDAGWHWQIGAGTAACGIQVAGCCI